MDNGTKFKVGDAVIVTAKDSSEGAHGQVVKTSKSPHFDYRVRLSDGIEWAYKADELELYEAARPEQGIRVEPDEIPAVVRNHQPFTDDDMQMWYARLATNYIGYMVNEDECCPGAIKVIMEDIASLVLEVERLRKQNTALYEALQPFAHAKSVVGFSDYTNTSAPYDAFTDALTAIHNYENENPNGSESEGLNNA